MVWGRLVCDRVHPERITAQASPYATATSLGSRCLGGDCSQCGNREGVSAPINCPSPCAGPGRGPWSNRPLSTSYITIDVEGCPSNASPCRNYCFMSRHVEREIARWCAPFERG